ncbi:LysM peptidoglycan-binding domain-containing protein [Pseudorhodoferax sp. LjRoot39]|uniref:LysM peptidoglycan-binding domain-containing protein n=1 Tax=Pseudorhodoferax sp. LjRoot39 TaxID=3342328 RepID=UPI003F4FBE8A
MFLVQRMTHHSLGIAALAAAATLLAAPVKAQNHPVTPTQRDTAAQVAQRGVALSELAPNAPDSYTVKSGDTLWGISGLFLARPWRWPELWGMNLQDIRNPHLIYPGQQLFLHKDGDRARLSTRAPGTDGLATVRVSPRVRSTSLADSALPTLSPSAIEPFLTESLVVEENALQNAPRIVATREQRVMLAKGDRAYARGSMEFPLAPVPGQPAAFRVVRNAVPLKDPVSGEVLGYEAYYLGKAQLLQGEGTREITDKDGKTTVEVVPASMDILVSKEDIRVGDRLLPEPPPELTRYVPHAPSGAIDGRVVSIYGSSGISNTNAAQSQVVAINKGTRDGLERGHVLTLLSDGGRLPDSTDPAKAMLKLPDETNGTLMVFRTFERVSYGLILGIQSGVKVGDRLVAPR